LRQLISLATLARLPSVTATRGYADEGGLMSYGPDYAQVSRRTGHYVGMILKGAAPGDLPIERATKFDLVVGARLIARNRLVSGSWVCRHPNEGD
jgi:putative tryptophan/tyrosine transport system substrate-binding protein